MEKKSFIDNLLSQASSFDAAALVLSDLLIRNQKTTGLLSDPVAKNAVILGLLGQGAYNMAQRVYNYLFEGEGISFTEGELDSAINKKLGLKDEPDLEPDLDVSDKKHIKLKQNEAKQVQTQTKEDSKIPEESKKPTDFNQVDILDIPINRSLWRPEVEMSSRQDIFDDPVSNLIFKEWNIQTLPFENNTLYSVMDQLNNGGGTTYDIEFEGLEFTPTTKLDSLASSIMVKAKDNHDSFESLYSKQHGNTIPAPVDIDVVVY